MTSVSKIAMRAELLSTISDALGSKNLKTLFTNTKDRIFVLPISEENDSLGVMMPLMTLNE